MSLAQTAQRPTTYSPLLYWTVTGMFVAVFGYAAVWALVDPVGTRADTLGLGYPGWTVYPLAIAKLCGLAVILSRRFRALTWLAFAGFFYDVVLALGAHIALGNVARGTIAAFGIAVTVGAFLVERQRRVASGEPAV